MRMYFYVMIILILLIAIPDIFFYRRLKNKNVKPIYLVLHVVPALFFTGLFLYMKFGMPYLHNYRLVVVIMWFVFLFLLIYIPKLLHIIFYFLHVLYRRIFKKDSPYFDIVRVTLTIIVVTVMFMSAYITPRMYEVTHAEVTIKGLPETFDGYKIVQLSDIHLGSWNRKYKKFEPVVQLVNEQRADLIVFTGDMVNNFANETEGWESLFTQFKAKDAKYAILGNHDYGDYTEWKDLSKRELNRAQIKENIRKLGFQLLLNENQIIRKGSDSIYIAGVENWGKLRDAQYGDINKALKKTNPATPKIMLSHDPTHWDSQIYGKKDIVLTLSGHTHAAQLGVNVFGRLYSPASLVFKYWYGLYHIENQYLYVNRGLGFIGIPMMIGVRPEITVLTLHASK